MGLAHCYFHHMPSFKASLMVKPKVKGGKLLHSWLSHAEVWDVRKEEELAPVTQSTEVL